MANGICRIFNCRHRHFGMRDHARMIATRNVVDFRLRTRCEFIQKIGRYDFVSVADDVPRRIVFQPIAAGALSVRQRAAKGRCVAANRAAIPGASADAKTASKYFAFT